MFRLFYPYNCDESNRGRNFSVVQKLSVLGLGPNSGEEVVRCTYRRFDEKRTNWILVVKLELKTFPVWQTPSTPCTGDGSLWFGHGGGSCRNKDIFHIVVRCCIRSGAVYLHETIEAVVLRWNLLVYSLTTLSPSSSEWQIFQIFFK